MILNVKSINLGGCKMTFIRRLPGRPFLNFRGDMERLFEEIFGNELENTESFGNVKPLVNIEESDNEFVVTAELAGMDKDDVKISFQDGTISISGEKKAEKELNDGNFHRYERKYGSFCRTFSMPNSIQPDKIDASFKNGVLTVALPKAEEAKTKEIKIQVK
jgi:HSP20 family protein